MLARCRNARTRSKNTELQRDPVRTLRCAICKTKTLAAHSVATWTEVIAKRRKRSRSDSARPPVSMTRKTKIRMLSTAPAAAANPGRSDKTRQSHFKAVAHSAACSAHTLTIQSPAVANHSATTPVIPDLWWVSLQVSAKTLAISAPYLRRNPLG